MDLSSPTDKAGSGVQLMEKCMVELPADLCHAAEQRFRSAFGNIEQLLEAVLTELLRDEAAQLHESETKLVDQRLRDLGYL
jgi:hypothetical protein